MNANTANFQRTKEDFACERCGLFVRGNGYTNHCPQCLWSKHVDVNPGDRQETCRGLMEPVGMEIKSGEYELSKPFEGKIQLAETPARAPKVILN